MLKALARRLDPLLRVHLGRYEPKNVETLRALVSPGETVWDVGANIGQMTYVLAKLVGRDGLVLAVEPGPENARQLRRHLGHRANVHIVEAAVSDTVGFASFAGDGESDAKISDSGPLVVRTVTLDSLLAATKTIPSLVKLDIEGHERVAFHGATRLLAEARPVFAVEFHGDPTDPLSWTWHDEVRAFVASFGYHWTQGHGGWFIASAP